MGFRSVAGLLFGLTAVLPGPVTAQSTSATASLPVWRIDPGHSDISFRIRHFVSKVRGTFNQWTGTIVGDPANWADASVSVTIQAASIDTRSERRDSDLRSENFFDVAKFPTITFQSRAVRVRGDSLTIEGDLTMHGVTRPVTLEGTYLGATAGARPRIGFEAKTTVDRTAFGVAWNRVVEGGGVMLGDEVEVDIAIEAALETPPAGP